MWKICCSPDPPAIDTLTQEEKQRFGYLLTVPGHKKTAPVSRGGSMVGEGRSSGHQESDKLHLCVPAEVRRADSHFTRRGLRSGLQLFIPSKNYPYLFHNSFLLCDIPALAGGYAARLTPSTIALISDSALLWSASVTAKARNSFSRSPRPLASALQCKSSESCLIMAPW